MIVRYMGEFDTTIPDDTVEDDDGIVQYGGKAVAEAVGEILERLGCTVEAPSYAGDHGWDFIALAEGKRFLCQITLADPNYLIFKNQTFSWFSKRPPDVYVRMLKALAQELAVDTRFSKIIWFDPKHYVSAVGADTPIDD